MPELPDVEVFRRYLNATALHQEVHEVQVEDRSMLKGVEPKELEDALVGTELSETRRHGKWLFAATEAGPWLILHFGMTGRLAYARRHDPPEHTRLLISFENGYHLAYQCQRRFGEVGLTVDPDEWIEEQELGPDAFGLPEADFRAILDDRRGGVKSFLMNQSALAGIGNIYADEILFQAHIHPETEIDELGGNARARLYRQSQRVLTMAVDRLQGEDGFPATWLTPHREPGTACPRCGTAIEKAQVGGRSTYFCPNDQPEEAAS